MMGQDEAAYRNLGVGVSARGECAVGGGWARCQEDEPSFSRLILNILSKQQQQQ